MLTRRENQSLRNYNIYKNRLHMEAGGGNVHFFYYYSL